MRPIQLHLLEYWSPVRMDMSVKIPLTPQLGLHLNWWLQDQNILKGYCFQPRSYLVTLTTDASLWGWGAHLNGYLVQGRWSKLQILRHVNLLELEAVFLAVKHFLPFLKNQSVLIRTDNTTVMHYIDKQGVRGLALYVTWAGICGTWFWRTISRSKLHILWANGIIWPTSCLSRRSGVGTGS